MRVWCAGLFELHGEEILEMDTIIHEMRNDEAFQSHPDVTNFGIGSITIGCDALVDGNQLVVKYARVPSGESAVRLKGNDFNLVIPTQLLYGFMQGMTGDQDRFTHELCRTCPRPHLVGEWAYRDGSTWVSSPSVVMQYGMSL